MKFPLVSVIMPVYNAEKHLDEAINSILNQTFTEFEFIILNDGSIDKSEEIIRSYNDSRIIYVKNNENLKIVQTLNKGIVLAKGKYIARMDADDICMPTRLEEQFAFMESNPDVGVCGTWVKAFGDKNCIWRYPCKHHDIAVHHLFHCSIAHPSVFIRRDQIVSNALLYDVGYPYAEDYEFWIRCASYFKLANIDKVLLHYRISKSSSSRSNRKDQLASLFEIDKKQLETLHIMPTH